MIKAFAKVCVNFPNATLLLVGEGKLETAIQNSVNRLGLTKNVFFLGARNDIPRLMNCADAYLMSSAWEGLPMVLLEAAASALPIVTTEVGGNREIVKDKINGFVVQPGDADALAKAMGQLMLLWRMNYSLLGWQDDNRFCANTALKQ